MGWVEGVYDLLDLNTSQTTDILLPLFEICSRNTQISKHGSVCI